MNNIEFNVGDLWRDSATQKLYEIKILDIENSTVILEIVPEVGSVMVVSAKSLSDNFIQEHE